MTSDVSSSHLLEFAFWALWVTAVLRNLFSKDPKVEDVANRHVFHVAKLGDTGVDQSDVFRAGCWGVVCEGKTLLETAVEELVRDGGTCQGVQEKDFCPRIRAAVKRTRVHTNEYVVKWREVLRFGLEKLQESMLEDGFRGLAVTGEPVEAHVSVQLLVFLR
jgi:hypothetical protein